MSHPTIPKDTLVDAAVAVDKIFPDTHGFILIAVPFGQPANEGIGQYTSNCKREDAVAILKTVLFRWGINDEWMKEAK